MGMYIYAPPYVLKYNKIVGQSNEWMNRKMNWQRKQVTDLPVIQQKRGFELYYHFIYIILCNFFIIHQI